MSLISKKNRDAIKSKLNREGFVRRLQIRFKGELGIEHTLKDMLAMFDILVDELKKIIYKGDAVDVRGFGMFYAKRMAQRVVTGGVTGAIESFKVPPTTKIGFSAHRSTNRKRGKK